MGGWDWDCWLHLQKKREKHTEYFVIVQSEGDTICVYISILYICALAFCVTLPFTCTMVKNCVNVYVF